MALQLNIAASSGNGSYITSYPASNMVDVTAAFTMMFWVNPSSIATGSGGGGTATSMVGVYNGTPTATTAPTTAMQMGINQGGTTAGTWCCWTWGGTNLVTSAAATALANTWQHFAYTCTVSSNGAGTAGTQTHSIYINGVLNNTATNASQVAGLPTMLYFNGYPVSAATTGSESNNTKIDDVYYFNRLLTANEILTIYTTMGQRDGETYGLIARYNFNELPVGSNVVSCTDFSGNNNTANATTVGTGTPSTYVQDYANEDTRPPL